MKKVEINCLDDLDIVKRIIRTQFDLKGKLDVIIKSQDESITETQKKQRTLSQNASLHKYCANISLKMNDAGYTQRQLVGQFKKGFELPVTMEMVKDIFREVGKAMFKKDSTKDLLTVEIQKVYDVVDMRFGEITGCRCEWPSVGSQLNNQVIK